MTFYRELRKGVSKDSGKYAVYMRIDNKDHYVCEMTDGTAEGDLAVNEFGLTLRARLTRSRGAYAMLEGSIFNPNRLLDAACKITDFKKEVFEGGEYKNGYTLLTITADGCTNKYMIFGARTLEILTNELEKRIKQNS